MSFIKYIRFKYYKKLHHNPKVTLKNSNIKENLLFKKIMKVIFSSLNSNKKYIFFRNRTNLINNEKTLFKGSKIQKNVEAISYNYFLSQYKI